MHLIETKQLTDKLGNVIGIESSYMMTGDEFRSMYPDLVAKFDNQNKPE